MIYLLFFLSVFVAAIFLKFGLALLRSRPSRWSFPARDMILGRITVPKGDEAYFNMGMVFNKRAGRIEICAKLNDEALQETLRK